MSSLTSKSPPHQGAGTVNPIANYTTELQKTVTITSGFNTITATAPHGEEMNFTVNQPLKGVFQTMQPNPENVAAMVERVDKMHQKPVTSPEHLAARLKLTQGTCRLLDSYRNTHFTRSPVIAIGVLSFAVAGTILGLSLQPTNHQNAANDSTRKD